MKRPKLLRKAYELTDDELDQLPQLRAIPGVAFAFWRRVAVRLGVDWRTILQHAGDAKKITALPVGHGKWWCYPIPLECERRPVVQEILAARV